MRLAPATPIGDLTEKKLERQVVDLARACGWRRYHTYRSKHSAAGYPDETLVRERVIFLELKTEMGSLSGAQRGWLGALLNAGAEAYLIRPRNLDALARVLAHRGDPWQARGHVVAVASALREELRHEIGEAA